MSSLDHNLGQKLQTERSDQPNCKYHIVKSDSQQILHIVELRHAIKYRLSWLMLYMTSHPHNDTHYNHQEHTLKKYLVLSRNTDEVLMMSYIIQSDSKRKLAYFIGTVHIRSSI
jgi:hypothetical protein